LQPLSVESSYFNQFDKNKEIYLPFQLNKFQFDFIY